MKNLDKIAFVVCWLVIVSMVAFSLPNNKLIPAQICDKNVFRFQSTVIRIFTVHFENYTFADIQVPDWIYYRYIIGDLIQVQKQPNGSYVVVVEDGR